MDNRWKSIESAPVDGTRFLAWCEIQYEEYDEDERLIASAKRERYQVVAYWAFGGFVEFPFRNSFPQMRGRDDPPPHPAIG